MVLLPVFGTVVIAVGDILYSVLCDCVWILILLLYSVLCVVLSSIRTQLSNKLKLANDFNFVQINVLCVQI